MEKVLQEFYKVEELIQSGNSISGRLELNAEHKIYQGHFPEIPIVPGVCQMEITREILSEKVNKNLRIAEVQNMKFLAVINPKENRHLTIKIDYSFTDNNAIQASSILSNESVVFFKFSGKFK